jgi:hypothetical protein
MSLKNKWKPKTNDDYVEAEDINAVADAVIELEDKTPSGGVTPDGTPIIIDDKMSPTSENPVQNKVVMQFIVERDTELHGIVSHFANVANEAMTIAEDALYRLMDKQDKVVIVTDYTSTSAVFNALEYYNCDHRVKTSPDSIDFNFPTGEYAQDYITGLSFYSDDTPPTISYTVGNIINWVGTDCSIDTYTELNGEVYPVSIFQPSANTQYDIIIYFNGACFVGMVNGYQIASYNKRPSNGGDITEF